MRKTPRSRFAALAPLALLPLMAGLPSPRPAQPAQAAESAQNGAAPAATPRAEGSGQGELAPLPEGVAATYGSEVITIEQYKDYLLRIYGRKPLQDMIKNRLLEVEAERLGIAIEPGLLEAEQERFWQTLLARHQGNLGDVERELAEEGYTRESYMAVFLDGKRRELLAQRICIATREITEEMMVERFEREYGLGGERVEVRHIFLNRAGTKRRLVRAGADPQKITLAELDAGMRQRAQTLLEALRNGADFESMARAESHDISVKQHGGMIPGYNYVRYGEGLAQAVREAPVGEPQGPVEGASGIHLFEVLSRVRTELDEVREPLTELLETDPASWAELRALDMRLRAAHPVRTY